MERTLKVSLTERDYYNFNKFHMRHSPYGKRNSRAIYIIAAVMALLIAGMNFIVEGVTLETVLMIFPYAVVIVAMLALITPLSLLVLKLQIAIMKKSGKLPYEESSMVELHDDYFVEITEKSRNEIKYTGAEGIMVASDGSIYVYMNSLTVYILPPSSFESDEDRKEISAFLCEKIDSFDKEKKNA